MKKLLPLFLMLIMFACEDKKDDAVAGGWKGTYKLSKESMGCDGDEDIQYLVVDEGDSKLSITSYDYDGDECDNGDDCYYKWSDTITKDGDGKYRFTEINEFQNIRDEEEIVIELEGTNIKVTITSTRTISGQNPIKYVDEEIWNKESSDLKSYSPTC